MNENDQTLFGRYRVVATVEKFYDVLKRIHSIENAHVGYKKTLSEIDLIDTRHNPDQSYNYHWSKFHILWALMNKSAVEVAMGLVRGVFPYFGIPKILQSDNGREFVNEVVRECLHL